MVTNIASWKETINMIINDNHCFFFAECLKYWNWIIYFIEHPNTQKSYQIKENSFELLLKDHLTDQNNDIQKCKKQCQDFKSCSNLLENNTENQQWTATFTIWKIQINMQWLACMCVVSCPLR